MAINPELEAAIEAEPDDEDGYHVYGDWLQGEGDPRGALIALQAAALRDPSNTEIAMALEARLLEETKRIEGALGQLERVLLSWHLGFLRGVRFSTGLEPEQAVEMMEAILRHPAGRFVRSISFADIPRLDPSAIADRLRALKRPMTLSELRVGSTWDVKSAAPDLLQIFPRLNQAIDVEWATIVARVAKHKRLALVFDPESMPLLASLPHVDVGAIAPDQILRGLRVEIDKKEDLGIIRALRRSFTTDSLDQLAVALAWAWEKAGERQTARWGFVALGLLGDVRTVDWIATRLDRWSHARCVQAAELLGQIGSPSAIWELYALSTDPRHNWPRRIEAARVLESAARARGLDVDRLLDCSMPPVAVREARVKEALVRRLHAHLVDGRRMTYPELVHYFVAHSLVAPLARSVVWACFDGRDVGATFRIDAEGQAHDVDGRPLRLDGATVGIVHPAELPKRDRANLLKRWGEVFRSLHIDQPFPQLDRPVLELREQEMGPSVNRFKLRHVGFDRLELVFERELDWRGERDDDSHGMTDAYHRVFPRDGVKARAVVGMGNISDLWVYRREQVSEFGSLHPVTASEILWAVDRATTKPGAAKPETAPTPASTAIEKGMRVRVLRTKDKGNEGVVFWLGEKGGALRCGLRNDKGETVWANVSDVVQVAAAKAEALPAPTPVIDDDDDASSSERDGEPLPPIPKGTKVRWKKGQNSGTGTAFWIGKNKFGTGFRVGVKDDETGETVWADSNDCSPV